MLKTGEKLDITNYTTLSNGIKFKIITQGSGVKPLYGQTATVHYSGWLFQSPDIIGTLFDSSVNRGATFKFPVGLGRVIKGWDLMVSDMTIGEKRIVILPPAYAYGNQSAGQIIKPNSTLIFEIELFEAK